MKLFFFSLLLTIGSCVALKPLKMKRVDNLTNKIKLNGIYVSSNSYIRNECGVYVLYNNGVMLSFQNNNKPIGCISYWEEKFKDKTLNYNDVPYWWGIYQIKSDSILFESWLSTDYYYPTISYNGKIINDTTLIVNYIGSVLDTFRFIEFSPKPDSTNKFIK